MSSHKNFEELISNIVDQTNIVKNSCKAQIIQISHSNNPEALMKSLRNCYETSELCDLLLLYITNRSPNISSCILFTNNVLNSCINECKKIDNIKISLIIKLLRLPYPSLCLMFQYLILILILKYL